MTIDLAVVNGDPVKRMIMNLEPKNKTKDLPPPLSRGSLKLKQNNTKQNTHEKHSGYGGINMEKQRYYNIITKEVIEVDDSNYYTVFPNQNEVDKYIILRGDEEVLLDKEHEHYARMHIIMTTKAIMVWIYAKDMQQMYAMYELSTDKQSHFELLNTLPDRLHQMVLYYEKDVVTEDKIQKASLLSYIKKAKKPTRKLKGKYKDVHN